MNLLSRAEQHMILVFSYTVFDVSNLNKSEYTFIILTQK